jgi:hypothetical protein
LESRNTYLLHCIAFSWSSNNNLATRVYKPSDVLKKFSFVNLFDQITLCKCMVVKRLHPFLNPFTLAKNFDHYKPSPHVRIMDLSIVQHPLLWFAFQQRLNHIPLRPTNFNEALSATSSVFQKLYYTFRPEDYNLNFKDATNVLLQIFLQKLRYAIKTNKFGPKSSNQYSFKFSTINNKIYQLLSNSFILGLNKANSNACLMCIAHICYQACHKLMGRDFYPYKDHGNWLLPNVAFDNIKSQLLSLLSKAAPLYNVLHFLVASFKQHKKTYRWLTNIFWTIYTNIATLITLVLVKALESLKGCAI